MRRAEKAAVLRREGPYQSQVRAKMIARVAVPCTTSAPGACTGRAPRPAPRTIWALEKLRISD